MRIVGTETLACWKYATPTQLRATMSTRRAWSSTRALMKVIRAAAALTQPSRWHRARASCSRQRTFVPGMQRATAQHVRPQAVEGLGTARASQVNCTLRAKRCLDPWRQCAYGTRWGITVTLSWRADCDTTPSQSQANLDPGRRPQTRRCNPKQPT